MAPLMLKIADMLGLTADENTEVCIHEQEGICISVPGMAAPDLYGEGRPVRFSELEGELVSYERNEFGGYDSIIPAEMEMIDEGNLAFYGRVCAAGVF